MAITPQILFTPAAAAVAAVSVAGMSVFTMSVVEQLRTEETPVMATCEASSEVFGPRQTWSELSWLRHAHCYDASGDSREAAAVALEGLDRHPRSTALHNVAGYHLIEVGAYRDASRILERGLSQLPGPSASGVMENNLAWSYLWLGEGSSFQAQHLYRVSLSKAPNSCETLHTGLMVEFEHARSSVGLQRAAALKSYQTLRTRYGACEHRERSWENLIETSGAAVLDVEVEQMLRQSGAVPPATNETLRVAADRLADDFGSELASSMCAHAIPMSDLRHECIVSILAAH